MINTIKIVKQLSELCHCIVPQLNTNFYHIFNQYRVNCLLRFLETEYNAFYNEPKGKLIIYIKDYPIDLESEYLKNIHYSFVYRKQQQLALPRLIDNIQKKNDLLLYIDFLLTEYINKCTIKDKNAPPNPPFSADNNMHTFQNPFFDYTNNFFCLDEKFPERLKNNILILPYINND